MQAIAVRKIERNPHLAVEQARELLARVQHPEHAKKIADQGEAIAMLLRRSGAALEVQASATTIVLWARRRIGELTSAMPRNGGGRPGGKTPPTWGKFSELEALGLTSAEISRCEALARVPVERLLAHIAGVAERSQRLTLRGTIAAVSSSSGYSGDEWRTPKPIVVITRKLLGGIDCDPATNAKAQQTIRARVFYTRRTDGLLPQHRWRGRVILNPPYSRGLIERFVEKFLAELDAGVMRAGLLIVNASTDTAWFHSVAERLPFVLTRGRFGFEHDAAGGEQSGARQGQALFGAGMSSAALGQAFAEIGLLCGAAALRLGSRSRDP